MWSVSQIFCGGLLFALSLLDIRYRQVPLWLLVVGGTLAVLLRWAEEPKELWMMLAGGLVGICFLAISRITKEALGYGDSILIVILGLFLGFWNIMYLLILAFFLSALFSIGGLALRYFAKHSGFPFIPFLTAAYIGILML